MLRCSRALCRWPTSAGCEVRRRPPAKPPDKPEAIRRTLVAFYCDGLEAAADHFEKLIECPRFAGAPGPTLAREASRQLDRLAETLRAIAENNWPPGWRGTS